MDTQILEYICKLLKYKFDSEVEMAFKDLSSKLAGLFQANFNLDGKNTIETFRNTARLLSLNKTMESYYQMHLGSNEIDETIFIRSATVPCI
jgi:hypothetical protein